MEVVSPTKEVCIFIAMVLCGILCGVVFDFFRSVRRTRRSNCGVVALQDIVFWIIELAVVYFCAFRLNYAKLRAYEALALIIGSCLYFMTLSGYVLKFICKIIIIHTRIIGYITKPICIFLGFVKKHILAKWSRAKGKTADFLRGLNPVGRITKVAETVKKNIKKHLYNSR